MDDKATLRLLRKWRFAFGARKLDGFIDQSKLANVANGKEQSFDILPGKHSLVIKLGHNESETLEFNLAPNSSADYECGVSPGYSIYTLVSGLVSGCIVLALIVLMLFKQNEWIPIIGGSVLILVSFSLHKILFSQSGKVIYLKKCDSDISVR